MFVVRLLNGRVVCRHVDHVRHRAAVAPISAYSDSATDVHFPSVSLPTPQSVVVRSPPQVMRQRRSSWIRAPPDRLM